MSDDNQELEDAVNEAPPPPPPPTPEPPPPTESVGSSEAGQPAKLGDRVVAVILDCLVTGAFNLIPAVGWIAGVGYLLTRDALPFLEGQSLGKKAMKLRAVNASTGGPLTNDWKASIIRNVVLYIPFFGLIELYMLTRGDQRLGDQWAGTRVVVVEG